jgi:peptidyl-prolyl cis-trans isomerase SurA
MRRSAPGPCPSSRRAALALALLAAPLAAPAAAEETLVDGIAAQVGSDIVLVSEVMQMIGPLEQELRSQGGTESDISRLRAEGLERMIERRLVEQFVKKSELEASDTEIDEAIARIADQNQLSVEALRESVTAHGLSYEDYRAQIKSELERRKVVSMMVGSRVQIEEAEVEALYAERFAEQPEGGTTIRLRQILVTYGKDADRTQSAACERVQAARQRVAAGEDFGLVASEVSEVAAERGGDIGWVHLDKAASWMVEVVRDLEPGRSSDVLVLPFACAMLQLVERREYQPVSYEQARPVLEQELYDRRMNEAMKEWVDSLRGQTYIERKGYFADAAKFAQPPKGQEPPAP